MRNNPARFRIGKAGLDCLSDIHLIHQVIPGSIRRQLIDQPVRFFSPVTSCRHVGLRKCMVA